MPAIEMLETPLLVAFIGSVVPAALLLLYGIYRLVIHMIAEGVRDGMD